MGWVGLGWKSLNAPLQWAPLIIINNVDSYIHFQSILFNILVVTFWQIFVSLSAFFPPVVAMLKLYKTITYIYICLYVIHILGNIHIFVSVRGFFATVVASRRCSNFDKVVSKPPNAKCWQTFAQIFSQPRIYFLFHWIYFHLSIKSIVHGLWTRARSLRTP